MTNIKWQVSLSNGETLNEDKGNFINDHTSSAWSKLRIYTQENNLEITALSLVTNDGRTFNLPSGGKRPRFSAFYNVEKPVGFNFGHKLGQDIQNTTGVTDDLFIFIEATYPDYSLQLWVDEHNVDNCWVLVLPKESPDARTTGNK